MDSPITIKEKIDKHIGNPFHADSFKIDLSPRMFHFDFMNSTPILASDSMGNEVTKLLITHSYISVHIEAIKRMYECLGIEIKKYNNLFGSTENPSQEKFMKQVIAKLEEASKTNGKKSPDYMG